MTVPGALTVPGDALLHALPRSRQRPCEETASDREEEDESITTILTEFGRDGWGEGGEEFGWWCTEAKEAFTDSEPGYRSMEPELRKMLGDAVYEEVVKYMDVRMSAGPPPLPHPAVVPVSMGRTRQRRP